MATDLKEDLPEELVFHVNYLGGDMIDFALNFSRPGGSIVAQYYNFLRLGKEGYRKIHTACYKTAEFLAREIGKLGPFEIIYNGKMETGIPALCWKIKNEQAEIYTLYDFANALRSRGWQVPAYSMPADREDLVIQRILVRHGVSRDLAVLLLDDMKRTIDFFDKHPVHASMAAEEVSSFKH